jgi:hypothetical protein
MSEKQGKRLTPPQPTTEEQYGLLLPMLLLLTSGTVTALWVGFLVWLPLHWFKLL